MSSNPNPPAKVGAGKLTAAVLASALSTIVVAVLVNAHVDVSADLTSAIQTLFTCLLVAFVPHNMWGGQ